MAEETTSWATVLTGIAAVISATAGLLAVLYQTGLIGPAGERDEQHDVRQEEEHRPPPEHPPLRRPPASPAESRLPLCRTVEDCFQQGLALREEGHVVAALEQFERAVEFVPPERHAPFAHLWCTKGEVDTELGRRDEARHAFEQCIEWTEGDRDLEGLRREAGHRLRELDSR